MSTFVFIRLAYIRKILEYMKSVSNLALKCLIDCILCDLLISSGYRVLKAGPTCSPGEKSAPC